MDELDRISTEYADRERRLSGRDIYSVFNSGNMFAIHQRQRASLGLLKSQEIHELVNLQVLEMGCGNAGIMTEFLGFGASPEKLFGVDLLFGRLLNAHQRLPGSSFANADGQSLPFQSGTFDLVLQYTAISSILDADIRRTICRDMVRVLKPSGVILSYDFWLNPTNKQTRGFSLSEIRSSFPRCQIDYQKITLAPPIARRLVPISWLLSTFLEKLTIFNSHYLVAIRPNH